MNLFWQKSGQRVTRAKKFIMLSTIGALTLGLASQVAVAQTKVVGYIPSYKNMTAVVNGLDLNKLTHINLSFMNPNAGGAFISGGDPVCMAGASGGNATGSEINYVVQRAHQSGVKVLVSVAGGVIPPCSGNWATLLQPANRQNVVNNLIALVNYYNLDGVDIDIEGTLLTNIDNAGNYTPFIQALRNGLPAGKLLTSATASYVGGMVPTSSLPYFDFVNIMSYDSIGPGWGTPGIEHSSYAQAQAHINTWKARGLTKEKLVLGVPFYGYGFGSYNSDYSFQQIVSQFGAGAAQNDVIGTVCAGCSYITYNGIPTIRNKTRLAMQEGSGVMIWEMSHDAAGAYSLLSAISSEIGGNTSSSSSSSSSSSTSSSSSSSSSVVGGQQCNWHGTFYPLCTHISSGWGFQNGSDCVSASTCATLSPPYGIVDGSSSSSSVSSSSSSTSACRNWVAGTQYNVGDVVQYQGNYYIAEHANPGYIPTVSTYFWEPVSASACGGSNSSSSSVSSSSSSTNSFSQLVQAESYANMSGVQLEGTTDTGGGQNVGWVDAGDWLSYASITFPTTGTYRVEYRVASVNGSLLSLDLNGGAIQLGQRTIPATGGWQSWQTVSHNVQVTAGTYSLGVYAQQGGWNINWLRITKI